MKQENTATVGELVTLEGFIRIQVCEEIFSVSMVKRLLAWCSLRTLQFTVMWTASSAYFVTLIAHGTMLVMILSDLNEYVMATLPLTDWTESEYADVEISLTTAVSLGIIFCAVEVVLLIFQFHTFGKAIFSMCLHLLATIFLLKFIVDCHPLHHFWIVFGVFSVPAILIASMSLCMSFNLKQHC